MYTYKAKIISVYDGDTVTAVVDLGFHINIEIKVRLLGINAPEVRGDDKVLGNKTKNRLQELVLNKEVILHTERDKQEKYGRWLGELWLSGSSVSINEQLINEKLAVRYE